jgi:hypothetical protein
MNKPFKTVKMYGPCLKGSGKTVNADVAEGNVRAFKAAGYELGSVDVEPEVQIAEMVEESPAPKAKKKK